MVAIEFETIARRKFLAGAAASGALALSGCSSMGGFSLVDAVRRLLERSASGALGRLTAPGGFWQPVG